MLLCIPLPIICLGRIWLKWRDCSRLYSWIWVPHYWLKSMCHVFMYHTGTRTHDQESNSIVRIFACSSDQCTIVNPDDSSQASAFTRKSNVLNCNVTYTDAKGNKLIRKSRRATQRTGSIFAYQATQPDHIQLQTDSFQDYNIVLSAGYMSFKLSKRDLGWLPYILGLEIGTWLGLPSGFC